ncbi:MAG: DUF1449 family protein [Polyangiaceae bacterium]|nr:DUF1449 family protein [Polyangiaceae bacterium]
MYSRSVVLEELFAWYNLIFYLPLALGVLLVLGMALGAAEPSHDLGDHDAAGPDGDAQAGADGDAHDAEHDAGGGSHSLLSLLGFGRVPVMILATTMCLVFGGVGVILNTGLTAIVSTPNLLVWGSLAGALTATVVLTGFLSPLLARLMREKLRAVTEVDQKVEVAKRAQQKAVAEAEAQRALAEAKLAEAETEWQKARQQIITVEQLAEAYRNKQKAVIGAEAEASQSYVAAQRTRKFATTGPLSSVDIGPE